jgi:hypothetical protein
MVIPRTTTVVPDGGKSPDLDSIVHRRSYAESEMVGPAVLSWIEKPSNS